MCGRVTAAEDGQPLAGIQAELTPNAGGRVLHSSSATDGTFAVGPAAAGNYGLRFSDPDGRRATVSSRTDSLGHAINVGAAVKVPTQGVRGLAVAIPLGYRVSGTVTSATGSAHPADQGQLCLASGPRSYKAGGECTDFFKIAADGSYASSPVPNGAYVILFYQDLTSWRTVYWSSAGMVTNGNSATPINVAGLPVDGRDGQVPW